MTNTDGSPYQRPLPELTPQNEFFWTSGGDGMLRFQRCIPCGELLYPPTPVCPYCHSTEIDVVDVSGRGTVVGFTVNEHQWLPTMTPPYVIANVALEEDDRVRLTTNIVGLRARAVHVGHEGGGAVRAARRRVDPAVRAHRRARARAAARRGRDHRGAPGRWRRRQVRGQGRHLRHRDVARSAAG